MPYVFIPPEDEPSDSEADKEIPYKFTYEKADEILQPRQLDIVAGFAFLELKKMGAKTFRVRYDGGYDEGFSNADTVTLNDGARTPKEIAATLLASAPIADLRAQLTDKRYEYVRRNSDPELMAFGLESLAEAVATALLGEGYGTGEYELYGACVLDFATCKITDDPAAKESERSMRDTEPL